VAAGDIVVFRADASNQIGTGHVMRCLCLADGLKDKGVETVFVSRHMLPQLKQRLERHQHAVIPLPPVPEIRIDSATDYTGWLGTSEEQDATDTLKELSGRSVGWVVVDHYALGRVWESKLRSKAGKILAIDDLANRDHDCDLLLDQNCTPDLQQRYPRLVPTGTDLLLGPRFALLRDEFKYTRNKVAPRNGSLGRILVLYGGVDPTNLTGLTVNALADAQLAGVGVDVVIGAHHPAQAEIAATCQKAGYDLHVQTDQVAQLMAAADFSFGAGGSTCWERCCMGLPAALVEVAENQSSNIVGLVKLGACIGLGKAEMVDANMIATCVQRVLSAPHLVREISKSAFGLVDGAGVERVLEHMDC
jgi:UDP-2,4-diacetamido-2,4,6-trideoxy-beta-L-altropyranose hydrolase